MKLVLPDATVQALFSEADPIRLIRARMMIDRIDAKLASSPEAYIARGVTISRYVRTTQISDVVEQRVGSELGRELIGSVLEFREANPDVQVGIATQDDELIAAAAAFDIPVFTSYETAKGTGD